MNNSNAQEPAYASVSHHYAAAWGEISQRIASRQHVYLQFTTVNITAIVAMAGAWIKGPPWSVVAEYGAVALVVYSWAFALWIRNHQNMIGLLGVYCKALEGGFDQASNVDVECAKGNHAWHVETHGWIVVARYFGRWSDYAATLVAFIAALPAALFGGISLYRGASFWGGVLVFAAAAGLGAAFFVAWNPRVRSEIGRWTPEVIRTMAEGLKRSP